MPVAAASRGATPQPSAPRISITHGSDTGGDGAPSGSHASASGQPAARMAADCTWRRPGVTVDALRALASRVVPESVTVPPVHVRARAVVAGGRPGRTWRRRCGFASSLALVICAALMTAMVIFVSANNTNFNPTTNVAAATRANRDAEILIAQDQAPRRGALPHGVTAAVGLERVIHRRLAAQVSQGGISGPLRAAHCRPAGTAAGARRAFRCTIESGGVVYPFSGVVATNTRRITFCKRDPPPVASDAIPISPLCRS